MNKNKTNFTAEELAEIIRCKEYLTAAEACIYMNMTDYHLRYLTQDKVRAIPYCKPNGKLRYFKKSDLDEYMQRNRIASMDEIIADAKRIGGEL